MKYRFGTLIVTSAVANNLRLLSQMLDKGDCDGMFTTALSATGTLPATHYISSGAIPKVYFTALSNPTTLFNVAKKAWEDDNLVFPFTQAQVTNTLSKCTVSDGTYDNGVDGPQPEGPHDLLARLGLKIINPPTI
jgi:hypothetical protein